MRRSTRCARRGWLEAGDPLASPSGAATQRQEIEDGTDSLASAPYAVLGEDGCTELRALVRP